jgi:sugar-phosphatase
VLRAVIFDLDGVLVDSEQLWRDTEIAVFGSLGVDLDDERCRQTTGLRVDEVVEHWYARHPWPAAAGDQESVSGAIVTGMVRALAHARVMPGAVDAVRFCAARGARVAVASSSPPVLISAALDRLGLSGVVESSYSAMDETYGKPHPAVYLSAAAKLGLSPLACVAVEDSLNGVLAAKAARMRCVAVPDRWAPGFAVADLVLKDLRAFSDPLWAQLEALCGS